MTIRAAPASIVALLVAVLATPASAQFGQVALDTVAATDASIGSDVTRKPGVFFDVFAAVRLAPGLDVVTRPLLTKRPFDGRWQKQMYQLGVRYERPGRVGLRLDAGQMPSPIGLAMLENRPDLNPVISQHSAYYLPLPRVDPDIPRSFLIAASYPFGAQATLSSRRWDARLALTDSSPVRGRPFFGSNKPPRLLNTVFGFGVTPYIGVRIGGAVAHGAYASRTEVQDRSRGDRDALMLQLEAEWSFRHTRMAGELVRSRFETARADAIAEGGWMELTQTLTPRWFVAARGDIQRFRYQRIGGAFERQRYDRYETIAGFRVTPDLTLRAGYMVRKGYVVFHWDDQMLISAVWQRKLF